VCTQFLIIHQAELILGKRQVTKPESPTSEKVQAVLESQLSSFQAGLKYPVCKSTVELDLRSMNIRSGEVNVIFYDIICYVNFYHTSRLLETGLRTCSGMLTTILCA
jgi:hypothetical protein